VADNSATPHHPTIEGPAVHGAAAETSTTRASKNSATTEASSIVAANLVQVQLPTATPKPGTNLAKIVAVTIKRDVYFRSQGEHAIKDQKKINGGRADYRAAAEVTARGDLTQACENCLIGRGKFTECAAIPGLFGGACGNCVYGGEHGCCANVGKYSCFPMKKCFQSDKL
jgi:hypothetical protein